MTFQEVLAKLKKRVEEEADPAKLANLDAVFQFELTGDNGGTFHARVADGKAEVVEAAHDNPNVTIIISSRTLTR